LGHDGPVLVDVVTNPSELAMPPKISVKQAGGFALYLLKETLSGHGDDTVEVIESNFLR
jgi:pyruvate dehydrogenase (quinone)